MTAARTGNTRIVETLLAHDVDVNATIPSTGQTALMWATAERHLDIMPLLIAAGADLDAQSTIGFTPLLFATRNGDIEAATMLLESGAGVNEVGSDGTHALPLAIVSGHDELALFLLERGADPNGTVFGVGALHAAAGNVDMWLRDWLRVRGANTLTFTLGVGTASRVQIVKALLDHGADPNRAHYYDQRVPVLHPRTEEGGVAGRRWCVAYWRGRRRAGPRLLRDRQRRADVRWRGAQRGQPVHRVDPCP